MEYTSLGRTGLQVSKICIGTNMFGADYVDDDRAIFARPRGSETELFAVSLDDPDNAVSLFLGPLMEVDVSKDGRAVAFSHGRGHMARGLRVLWRDRPADPSSLPRARAPAEVDYVVSTRGQNGHVHMGGWSADSQRLVYTQDLDHGDVIERIAAGRTE